MSGYVDGYARSAMCSIDPIIDIYYPNLTSSVHACLAVVGSMALAGRTLPLSLILEGRSGFGKTAVLQMFFPSLGSELEKYVYRSDRFTPRSFVSHAANVRKNALKDVDLLPRLRNRVLVTKELAPLFRGREEEMQENFSMLISVLDGKGFTSDTGMHGRRGYQEKLVFNWIGATTPLPARVHNLMAQLGTRLLFWEVPSIDPTEDELVEYANLEQAGSAESDCRDAVETFLIEFFAACPVGKLSPLAIAMSEGQSRSISRYARFLVAARAEIHSEKDGTNWRPVSAMKSEGPWKVVTYLKELAKGHALICGRDHLDDTDIALVEHVALSSIPGHLRPVVRSLRLGSVSTPQAEKACSVAAPTARNYLKQLVLLGVADSISTHKGNQHDVICFANQYSWMKC